MNRERAEHNEICVEGHAEILIFKSNGKEVEGEKHTHILFTKMRGVHILLYLCGPIALNLI